MTDTITLDEYRKMAKPGRSKYGNVKVAADGYTFDSKAEHAEYQRLVMREAGGQISQLKVHPTYTLMEGFRTKSGAWVRPIVYEADFSYFEDGWEMAVDVKGVQTDVFKIKSKLLMKAYPNVRLLIVGARSRKR